jgi:predicted  nucleic acid-binding Zn-ribbon protein
MKICLFFSKNQSNEQLTKDLQSEQKQTNSYRSQIETLTNEIHELEKTFEELKHEKNQLFLTKMDGDEDDERQNLVRQLTQEKVKRNICYFVMFISIFKDQYEQQTKELRKQLKQINEEKDKIQEEFDNTSKQVTQINNEKVKINISLFKIFN